MFVFVPFLPFVFSMALSCLHGSRVFLVQLTTHAPTSTYRLQGVHMQAVSQLR